MPALHLCCPTFSVCLCKSSSETTKGESHTGHKQCPASPPSSGRSDPASALTMSRRCSLPYEVTVNYNLQLIVCFLLLFLSFLPYLWHGEGQGQACSEFRYCFTAWHFSLSAIKDWQFLNPFQNATQPFYFLRSRIILPSVPANGN